MIKVLKEHIRLGTDRIHDFWFPLGCHMVLEKQRCDFILLLNL